MNLMSKERLISFTDAVLAIIIDDFSFGIKTAGSNQLAGSMGFGDQFFRLHHFFLLVGNLWVNLHRSWDVVDKINSNLVWSSIVLLFFSSFFPYTTALVSADFNNSVAQTLYGVIVLLVTACNVWMYHELHKLIPMLLEQAVLTFQIRKVQLILH